MAELQARLVQPHRSHGQASHAEIDLGMQQNDHAEATPGRGAVGGSLV